MGDTLTSFTEVKLDEKINLPANIRQDLIDLISDDWFGDADQGDFLDRLYNTKNLPSTDARFEDMSGDIFQHTVNNDDWRSDWIFQDSRLGLSDDATFLRLVAETVHPRIIKDEIKRSARVDELNSILRNCSLKLQERRTLAGRAIYEISEVKAYRSTHLPGFYPDINNLLGSGGFGKVYKYTDQLTGAVFAVKILEPSPFNTQGARAKEVAKRRFFREAGALLKLNHENIIKFYHIGEFEGGEHFIKMEYFEGKALREELNSGSAICSADTLLTIGKLSSALEHAHRMNIFHRDLCPRNILFMRVGGKVEIRIIDFGLASMDDPPDDISRLTTSADYISGDYSAPELSDDPKIKGPELDIYSLGAVWYHMITGSRPKGAEVNSRIEASSLSAAEKSLLASCLADRSARPTSEVLVASLRTVWRTRTIQAM